MEECKTDGNKQLEVMGGLIVEEIKRQETDRFKGLSYDLLL